MQGNVRPEALFDEFRDDFWFFVWCRFGDSRVKKQWMAERTMFVVIDRLHVGARGIMHTGGRRLDGDRGFPGGFRRSVGPRLRGAIGTVAIDTFQLDVTPGTFQVFFQVDLVIEFDSAGVAEACPQGSKFRVTGPERFDVSDDAELAVSGFQIGMACRAGLISSVQQFFGALVLNMTLDAVRRGDLLLLMDGTIVTGQACVVGDA